MAGTRSSVPWRMCVKDVHWCVQHLIEMSTTRVWVVTGPCFRPYSSVRSGEVSSTEGILRRGCVLLVEAERVVYNGFAGNYRAWWTERLNKRNSQRGKV